MLIPGLKASVINETEVLEETKTFYHENNQTSKKMQHVLRVEEDQFTGVQDRLGISVGLKSHFKNC